MATGTHEYVDDPRNAEIFININGEFFPRSEAKISVFDSGFILGDGVWEGIRLHHGRLAFIDKHIKRLFDGAKALDLDIGLSKASLVARIEETCAVNNMQDGVHIRLMVTQRRESDALPGSESHDRRCNDRDHRGVQNAAVYRRTSRVSIYSRPMCGAATPTFRIPKLNTHSKLNCIFACIQAAKAGVDEALMLDPHGFVATCNSTHFFIIRQGEVWTSSGDFCLDGITRRNVIDCCKRNGIPVYEKNFTLADVYAAEEAFVTGTFAGLTAVRQVDGRLIGNGEVYPQLGQLQGLYIDMIESEASE